MIYFIIQCFIVTISIWIIIAFIIEIVFRSLSTACYEQSLLVSNYTKGLIRTIELLKIGAEERITEIIKNDRRKN